MNNRKKLEKMFTREHSLFYCFVWNSSDRLGLSRWAGMSPTSLFQGEGKSKKLSVWYSQEELDTFFGNIEKKVVNDPEYFVNAKKEFYKYWDLLLPFIKKEKEIEGIEDLEYFFDIFVKWWSPMAAIIYIPDMKNAPKDVQEEAYKIREETQHYSDDGDNLFVEFFDKNFPEYKELTYVISPKEIFSLKDKKLSTEEIDNIKKRLEGYFVYNEEVYLSSRLNEILEKGGFELDNGDEVLEEGKEIKGESASKGFVTGKVRLVLYKKQIGDVLPGEILVTEMTSPDFVLAMEKSSAIITDEGGITCHAAIVSREMNKPCVIGTKIATKVLKDGDIVEVDADNGIIKILNK